MSFSSTGLPKGKKMHQCDFCERFFSTASNMREHRRTHTGEKPFVCRYCGKAFAQSSTHSKHLLVHKTKEKLRSDTRESLVRQINEQRQEQDLSKPSLTRCAVSLTSQFHTGPSLLPSKTFIKTLQEHKQSEMKMEVDFFDNSDWHNSNSVLGTQVDTSLQFNNVCDAAITPASSFNHAKDNEQRSFTDQKPVITGMFKNRVCKFSPLAESKNLQVKQETLDVKEINFEMSSFPAELGLSGNKDHIQYEEAKNKTALEDLPLFLHEAKIINCDDSKAFHSALPQPVLSKGINRDDQWNGSLEDTSIIQLDLTSEGEDTLPETQDKFQSNIETFFKCIHCSETFSSLEEHICLAKEAKMFFKCQICQKMFAQYGPFFRHKQSHENPKQFVVSPTTYKAEKYKKYDSTTADNIRKESNDISEITDGLHLRRVKEASCTEDLLASSLPAELSRIHSSMQLREEQNSNDDVIIIDENTVQTQPREKLLAIPTYPNTDRFNNSESGYFERSNLATDDVGTPQKSTLNSQALLKPNAVEQKTGNISRLEKWQAHLKKNPQQIGKRGHPFTCMFCPRKFSTASNMREHMRIHTGEKPFSCELCHKKFAQSSTRSKHMQIHIGYKMSGYHLYGKKFTQTKNYKKHLKKPGKYHENPKPFLPNRFANIKEKPKVHPTVMKAPCNKSYTSLPYSKANQLSLKKSAFGILPEPSNNFSFPPKTVSNKILTAKLDRRANNDNLQFGYNKECTNRMNVLHEKTDCIVEHNNNQNLKNKMSFPLAARSDSHISVFGSSSFENSKTQTGHLLPSTTLTVLPRPKSRHRGAHRLLRNARNYRPFRCTYCPRTFSTSGNMKEHMRTHTGEKPFRCEYCHRRFAQSSTHSKHVQIHIRKQQLNCFFCGKFFTQVALLRSHIVTDHKMVDKNSSTNNLSANLCGSSNLATVNKSGTGFPFGSNGQSESFLDSIEKNSCSQEAKIKKKKIIEIPDSNLENVSKYEINPSLTEKRLATSAKANMQQQQHHHHQSQIKSGFPSAFELTQIKAHNSALSSIIELESSKSLAKDLNLYSEIKPLDNSSSVDGLNAQKLFNMEEELNNCTSSREKMVDKIFLNDYSYKDQLINLSANKILESCMENKEKRPTKLQIGSPQNIDKGNLTHYDQTLGNLGVEFHAAKPTATVESSNQYVQSKVGMYNNSFLDKGKKLNPQVYSPLLKSDPLPSSPSSFSVCFTPPALTNHKPADHFPANAQISTINKVRNEALHSLSNEQGNSTFVFSQVTNCEQSLGSKISFELTSHQVEQSLDFSRSIPDHKAIEQNVPELLNSEHSLNPCSGDTTKKLNVNWLLDIVPKTKSEREEITSDFVENCNSKILSSKMVNSLQEGLVAVLSNSIKLEQNVLCVDTEWSYVAKDAQVENATNSDVTKATSISDSLDSNFCFNVSNIAANVQYSVTSESDRNKIIADNSRPFCDKGETISLDKAAFDTSLARISFSELTSVCADTENQQLRLNSMLPNNVGTSSVAHLEKKRKNLQWQKIVRKFKCIHCNRCFSTRSNMREHMRIHTGEKPFECVFCFRRFAQSSTHSKHVQTHLRFRKLVCPQCGRRFPQANNLCQHIRTHHRISHTSATSLAKKIPLCLDPVPQTAQISSYQIKQISNNKDKHLPDSSENNQEIVNVHKASIEPSEIYKQTKTYNEDVDSIAKHFIDEQSHLSFLNNKQTNEEMSDVLSKIPTQLLTSKDEKTESTIDVGLGKTNFTIDLNFPTPNETGATTESLQDVSFDTIDSNLNQSDLPLNKLRNALTEQNNDPKFSSSTSPLPPSSSSPTFSSLPPPPSTVCPVSVIEPTKEEKKKSLMLHFHRCLFCSKMFDALINVQEHLRSHVEDEESSLQSKYDRKLRECSTWYKHVEIVLGIKLRLPTRTSVRNAQHLKIIFDVGERLKSLLHRNLYKCGQCRKECATFQSLLFHRRTHVRKLTGKKIPTLSLGKLTKRAQGPTNFLHKRPSSSLIFSLEPVVSNNGRNSSRIESQQESRRVSLPILCFSLNNQFWLVNLNGTLRALGLYSRYLPVDKSPMTKIGSSKQHPSWNVADSHEEKSNEIFDVFRSEEGENADPTNKCFSEDKLKWPLHFSLNNLENTKIDLNVDDSKEKDDVLLGRSTQSPGVMKRFGQEVTTMVSLQLKKCVNCSKMFPHVGHLEKHLQVHTGKVPFQCTFCPKTFTNFGTFSRHKNLTHSRQNRKSCIPRCRKNKSNPDLQESVESKFLQTKPQSTLDMKFTNVDTAYVADLLKKVLNSKRTEDFSDSPFVQKLSSEKSSKFSEIIEYPPRLSNNWLPENGVNLSGQPFQSHESKSNVCVIENFQFENKELACEISFVEGDDSNKTAQGICAMDNSPTEEQIKNEEKEIFSSLNRSKAVGESNTSVKRKADIFSHNWQKGEVGAKEKMFSSQSSHNAERQVDSKCDSDKEAQINQGIGNDSTLVANTDSNGGFNENHLKEDTSVECIFINDDPDDHSQDECCILDVSSSSSQYLPNRNEKTDTSEIIVLSDEEKDDNSTPVKTQSFNDRNSLIKLCNNTDNAFLIRLKENQIEDQLKADCKLSQDVYKSLGMSFKNCKSNYLEITGQKPNPNLNDLLGTVSTHPSATSPLQISKIATNSSKMAVSSKKTSNQSSKVHPCLYCSKICSSSSNLKEHMRSHTGERPFSCRFCHKMFAQKSTLSKHTQIHARFKNFSPVSVPMQQSSAGYNLVELNSLNPHPLHSLVEHSSLANQFKTKHVSNISLDPTHQSFKASTNRDSYKINTDVCDSHGLVDKKSSNMKPIISFESDKLDVTQPSEIVSNPPSSCYHVLASGIYPLPQSSANVLTSKPILKKANPIKPCISEVVPEISVPNKPHLCDVCDRTFTTSGNLKEHRRTHTGERPFECPFCEKTFVQASTRSRHVKNHSKHFVN